MLHHLHVTRMRRSLEAVHDEELTESHGILSDSRGIDHVDVLAARYSDAGSIQLPARAEAMMACSTRSVASASPMVG